MQRRLPAVGWRGGGWAGSARSLSNVHEPAKRATLTASLTEKRSNRRAKARAPPLLDLRVTNRIRGIRFIFYAPIDGSWVRHRQVSARRLKCFAAADRGLLTLVPAAMTWYVTARQETQNGSDSARAAGGRLRVDAFLARSRFSHCVVDSPRSGIRLTISRLLSLRARTGKFPRKIRCSELPS